MHKNFVVKVFRMINDNPKISTLVNTVIDNFNSKDEVANRLQAYRNFQLCISGDIEMPSTLGSSSNLYFYEVIYSSKVKGEALEKPLKECKSFTEIETSFYEKDDLQRVYILVDLKNATLLAVSSSSEAIRKGIIEKSLNSGGLNFGKIILYADKEVISRFKKNKHEINSVKVVFTPVDQKTSYRWMGEIIKGQKITLKIEDTDNITAENIVKIVCNESEQINPDATTLQLWDIEDRLMDLIGGKVEYRFTLTSETEDYSGEKGTILTSKNS